MFSSCIPAAVLALLFVTAQKPGRLVIGLIVFPNIFHYARNLLAQSASLPHVLTARAKGAGELSGFTVAHSAGCRPAVACFGWGLSMSIAFGAAIPVEVLCDLPGIGQLAWKAAMGRDLVLLVNLTMIVTLINSAFLANSAAELVALPLRAGDI